MCWGVALQPPTTLCFFLPQLGGCLGRFCLPRKLGWVTIDLFPHPRSSEVPVAVRLGSDPEAVLNKQSMDLQGNTGCLVSV